MKYKLHTLVRALTFKAGSFGTHFAPYRFEIFPKFGICPRKSPKKVWYRCSHGTVSKKQSRPLKLCKATDKGFDIFVTFFFFWIRPSNLQHKTSKLPQNRWKISQIEWHFKSARARVSVAMELWLPVVTRHKMLLSYNYKLLYLCRTTISYYTYIMPYSLGRKYTYKIEKHPPDNFFLNLRTTRSIFPKFQSSSSKGYKVVPIRRSPVL